MNDVGVNIDDLLKRLHLANARRSWRELVTRAEKEQWSYERFLGVLVSEEVAQRQSTRLRKVTAAARFPFLKTIDEYDFLMQSQLRLTMMGSYLSPDFVTDGRSLILSGKPGRGKTHLAIAIAYRAIQNGFDARFVTAAELIDELSLSSRTGHLREMLGDYVRCDVLVVDEVGYLTYGSDAANVLFHVVNERHLRKRAMIFTTNKPLKQWGQVLHDDDLAEAIIDRVLERGRHIKLDGPSGRTKHLPRDEHGDDSDSALQPARVSGSGGAEFPEPTDAHASRGPSVGAGSRPHSRRTSQGYGLTLQAGSLITRPSVIPRRVTVCVLILSDPRTVAWLRHTLYQPQCTRIRPQGFRDIRKAASGPPLRVRHQGGVNEGVKVVERCRSTDGSCLKCLIARSGDGEVRTATNLDSICSISSVSLRPQIYFWASQNSSTRNL